MCCLWNRQIVDLNLELPLQIYIQISCEIIWKYHEILKENDNAKVLTMFRFEVDMMKIRTADQ